MTRASPTVAGRAGSAWNAAGKEFVSQLRSR